jgi:fatty acid desaturase
MDILATLVNIAIIVIGGGIALIFVIGIIYLAGMIIWNFLPVLAGLAAAIWLWWIGHDNIAVIAAILGIALQKFWPWPDTSEETSSGTYYDPLEGKKKWYDNDGNQIGGEDYDR